MTDARYPIGQFQPEAAPSPSARHAMLSNLADISSQIRCAVAGLSETQLETPYRPGGWTIRQVVHHLADSHLNWYMRTKLALTEDTPAVKAYDEARWAELHDARTAPIEPSLRLLEGLCSRCVDMFRSLTEEQWGRTLVHPERGVFVIAETLPMHVWHGRHHTAQIVSIQIEKGWKEAGGRSVQSRFHQRPPHGAT